MSLFNLDDIRRKIRGQGQQGFQQAFEDYNKNFNQLQERAQSRYKNANKWGLIHKILGGFGAVFSCLSLIFTFFDNAQITAVFSGISAIAITANTFLDPSKRERQLSEMEKLCEFIELDFISIRPLFTDKKTSDLSKEKALENLGRSLRELSSKVNERL